MATVESSEFSWAFSDGRLHQDSASGPRHRPSQAPRPKFLCLGPGIPPCRSRKQTPSPVPSQRPSLGPAPKAPRPNQGPSPGPAPDAPGPTQGPSLAPVPEAPRPTQGPSLGPAPEAPGPTKGPSLGPVPEAPGPTQGPSLAPAPKAPGPTQAPSLAPAPEAPGPNQAPTVKPAPKARGRGNTTFPAIFAFGDSILDTGNNDYILTLIRANFRPYGVNFPDKVPTGRFCDGKIPSDYIAEYLGVKPTLPPYLDPSLTKEDLLTGVSFASGGSGFDPLTPVVVRAVSMSDQLKYFREYIQKVKGFVGKEKTEYILAKSLAVVIAGSDDLANTYYGEHARQFLYDIDSYTSYMASTAATFAMQLYETGARKIGFIGISPIGCIPSQRTTRGGLNRDCSNELNSAAQLFNSKLSKTLNNMAKTLTNATLVYIDIYTAVAHMIDHPEEYGFTEIAKGCCGTGLFELGPLCNQYTSVICSNASAYLFWDSYHPTDRAYKYLTERLIENDMGPFYDH